MQTSVLARPCVRLRLAAALAASALALASAACQCIEIPANDSVDPQGTLSVIYQDPDASGFHELTVSVDTESANSDRSVILPENWPFQLFWHAQDEGGVRELALTEIFHEPPPETGTGSISQPLFAHPAMPDGDFSDCAKTYRALSVDWTPWSGSYEFRLTATDFHGNQSTTPWLILQHE